MQIRYEVRHDLFCIVLQFEEALNKSDPCEGLRKLVDPRLGENYPIDSVLKVGSNSLRKKFNVHLPLFSFQFWLYKKIIIYFVE